MTTLKPEKTLLSSLPKGDMMHAMLVRYFILKWLRLGSRFPAFVLGASFSAFFAAALLLTQLTQSASIVDQLDPSMQTTTDLIALKSNFSDSMGLVAVITPKNVAWNNHSLCDLQNWMIDLRNLSPKITSLLSPLHLRIPRFIDDGLYYPTLINNPCSATTEQDLSALAGTPWQHFLTDPRLQEFTMTIGIEPNQNHGLYGTFDPSLIKTIFEMSSAKLQKFKVEWIGVLAQQFYTIEGMAQSQWLNLLIGVVFIGGLRLLFGTWIAGVLFIGTLLFSSAFVYGGMALFKHPMDVLSVSLFLMLSVASLEDFIFVSYNRFEEPKAPFRKHFRKLAFPCFWTSLTTALGFASLSISSLQSIRYFGLWAAFGSMVEWLAVFIILPALFVKLPSLQNWVNPERSFFYSLSQKMVAKTPRRWATRLALLVFPLGMIAVAHLELAQTPTDTFPADHPMAKTLNHLKDSRGWIVDASLVFSPGFAAEKQAEVLLALQKNPMIQKIETEASVIEYLTQGMSSVRKSLVSRDFKFSPLAHRYESPSGETRALLTMNDSQTEKVNSLRRAVQDLCPDRSCYLTGEFVAFADFSKSLISTLFESFFLSLFLVTLVLAYLVWSMRGSLKELPHLLISSFWGPMLMMCLMWALNTSVNMVTCIVASILVGLTGDNAIQYLFASKQSLNAGIEKRAIGSLQCSLMMTLSSLVFLGSYFEPPRTLGSLLAAGFLTALIGDLWILKGLKRS